MREKFQSSINFTEPGQFHLPGQHGWVVGRRSGALFFARHLDYCIVTRYWQPLPGLVTVTQLHRDPKLIAFYQDWQKTRHRDAPLEGGAGPRHQIKPPGRYKASKSCTQDNLLIIILHLR